MTRSFSYCETQNTLLCVFLESFNIKILTGSQKSWKVRIFCYFGHSYFWIDVFLLITKNYFLWFFSPSWTRDKIKNTSESRFASCASVFPSWLKAHLFLWTGDKSCRGQCSPVYELHECYFRCAEAGDIPEFKWVLLKLQELYKVLFCFVFKIQNILIDACVLDSDSGLLQQVSFPLVFLQAESVKTQPNLRVL